MNANIYSLSTKELKRTIQKHIKEIEEKFSVYLIPDQKYDLVKIYGVKTKIDEAKKYIEYLSNVQLNEMDKTYQPRNQPCIFFA